MVRQYHPGIDVERRAAKNPAHDLPQRINVGEQKPGVPV
jgi:hypothetical protein